MFELDKLTIRDTSAAAQPRLPPGRIPPWLTLWNEIESYRPSNELELLLQRASLQPVWTEACNSVTRSDIAKLAFERSKNHPETRLSLLDSNQSETAGDMTLQSWGGYIALVHHRARI